MTNVMHCLQRRNLSALLRFRMGCHNLPWDHGHRQGISRLHRVCTFCAGENPGDEQHVVFECPGLQIFVTDIKACLESMQLPCFNSCGKMTFVVLRCLSRNAWEYIMALTLMGVRHLISPRWLEKM